jgi:hypothetical protein
VSFSSFPVEFVVNSAYNIFHFMLLWEFVFIYRAKRLEVCMIPRMIFYQFLLLSDIENMMS